MKKQVNLKELRVIVRRLVENELDDELNTVEVGDVVDVDVDEIGTMSVRVLELVDDVNAVAGPRGADTGPGADFHEPGFVGEIDPTSGESGQMVFSLNQVMPGSKAKGYFPKLGDEFDEDEFGRPMNNPYRKGAHLPESFQSGDDDLIRKLYDNMREAGSSYWTNMCDIALGREEPIGYGADFTQDDARQKCLDVINKHGLAETKAPR